MLPKEAGLIPGPYSMQRIAGREQIRCLRKGGLQNALASFKPQS
jgi:hypothetical protein